MDRQLKPPPVNTSRAFLILLAIALLAVASLGALAMAWSVHQRTTTILKDVREINHRTTTILEELHLISPRDLGHRRLDVRSFVIRNQLSQADHPIVFMGDSITESARLPSSICDRPVVNAGVGASNLGTYAEFAKEIVQNLDAALIVVALGINDAGVELTSDFKQRYLAFVHTVLKHAPKAVLVGIPPIEDGPLKNYFDIEEAQRIDDIIREVAHEEGAEFVDLRAAIKSHPATVDGVHLWARGYKPWLAAITDAIGHALPCSP
jgi:lysophospholipase L1-like esterase